jgi:histidinol-phosphate aminotransferase
MMSRFLHASKHNLKAYVPGEQPRGRKYIKLNTNESPFPPSPEVQNCLTAEVMAENRLYPDPEMTALRELLAKKLCVSPKMIMVGNGSDDILNTAFLAFAGEETPVAFPDITYGFYKVYADLYQLEKKIIPLREDFRIDASDYFSLDSLIAIANPNAPTGIALTLGEIERILQTNPDHVVLIDEAYVAFGADSALPLLKDYENLLVVRTFSKSRSLAGARLGFAAGSEPLIEGLNRIRYSINPYNVSRLAQRAGEAALYSDAYYVANVKEICRIRENTKTALEAMGFEVLPSKSNFLFTRKAGCEGEKLYSKLKERGILVRHFSQARISDFIRVTVGSEGDMRIFLENVKSVIE